MKKLLSILLALILLILSTATVFAAGFTPPFDVSAQSAFVMNVDTGLVLYEKNADEKRSIASITKLMTILLFLEKVPAAELDTTEIYADPSLYKGVILQSGSSTADIRPFEVVTARSLLYAMILPSANEAAEIVGNYVGDGNMQNFYAMMNARAKQLGCTNTNFANAHGLEGIEKGNYSSARDVSRILLECYKYDIYKEVSATISYQMPATNKHANPYNLNANTNKMISKSASVYREYIKAGKTGSTPEAGRNFACVATKDASTYVSVVLGAPWEAAESGYALSLHDTASLLDWAFKDFSVRPALDPTAPITEIGVLYSSETDVLKLFPVEEMQTILPNGSDETVFQKKFDLPQNVQAPIKKGDVIGTVTLTLAGDVIGTSDLLAGNDVNRNFILFAIAKLKDFVTGLYFRVVLIVSTITFVGYAIFAAIQNKKAKKTRKIRKPKL